MERVATWTFDVYIDDDNAVRTAYHVDSAYHGETQGDVPGALHEGILTAYESQGLMCPLLYVEEDTPLAEFLED